MKKAIVLLLVFIVFTWPINAQDQSEISKLKSDPDHFPESHKVLDSVVQYSYSSFNSSFDSSYLHRWEYLNDDLVNNHKATKYTWVTESKEWRLDYKYVLEADDTDMPIMLAHYYWDQKHNEWYGCGSDGCGKREWAYDSNGNQTRKTQYFWDRHNKKWLRDKEWEDCYDDAGNQTLEAFYFWDSPQGIWRGTEKNEYSYDINGNQLGYIGYSWDYFRLDWQFIQKTERSYDTNGNNTIEAFYYRQDNNWTGSFYGKFVWHFDDSGKKTWGQWYSWDEISEKWGAAPFNLEFVYDDGGKLISEVVSSDVYAIWVSLNKHNYDYDSNGNKISDVVYFWYDISKVWLELTKHEYAYNSDGDMISTVTSNPRRWSYSDYYWILSLKDEYSYDKYRNQTKHINFYWDEENDIWSELEKEETEFDQNGNTVMYSNYRWDSVSNTWEGWPRELDLSLVGTFIGKKPAKYEYNFNDRGYKTLNAEYFWDPVLSTWRGTDDGKIQWSFNSVGQLLEETKNNWNIDNADWERAWKSCYIYDEVGDPLSLSRYAWNTISSDWEPVIRFIYYYQSSITSFRAIKNPQIELFPNPTSGVIYITELTQPAEARLYSIQGRLLKTINQVESSIDISDLPAGVYILNLTSGDQVLRERIVKR